MKFRILFFASFYFIFANFVNAQTVVCTWAGGDLGDETNWDNDANWTTTIDGAPAADAKPTNTSNVIIPNSVTNSNYPVVSSGTCVAANVTIDANGGSSDPSLTINGTQTLDIEGDFLMNGGTLVMNNSSVFDVNGDWDDQNGVFILGNSTIVLLSASADQTISCGPANSFKNLQFTNDNVSVNNRTALTNITISRDLDIQNKTNFGIGNVTVTVGNFFRFLDIESNASISLDHGGSNLIVESKLRSNASGQIIFNADANINFKSTPNVIGTLTTNNSGTIAYNSASNPQNISQPSSGNYYNLIFDQNNIKTASESLAIDGNLTISNDATFADGGLDHNIAGNWDDSDGTFNGTATIILDGAAQDITTKGTNSFLNLQTQGSGDKTPQTPVTITGTFTVTSGTYKTGSVETEVTGNTVVSSTLDISNINGVFDADGEFDATGGNVTFTGNGNLELGGVVTDLGTFTCGTGTVKYDLAGAQNIIQPTNPYFNLSLIGSTQENKTAADGTVLDVDGDFVLDGCTFNPGNNNHDLAGSWTETNSAIFDPNEGTITFSGANSNETITTLTNLTTSGITIGDDNSFYQLVIDANDITTASEIDVDNATTINNLKKLTIGAFKAEFPLANNFTINGTLNLSDNNSEVNANGSFDATNGIVTFGGSGILNLHATTAFFGSAANGAAAFVKGTGTVKYLKTNNQNVFSHTDLNYHNLVIEGDGDKTSSNELNVDNDLTVNSNTSTDKLISNNVVTILGNLTMTSGTFDANANVVINGNLNLPTNGILDFASNNTFNLDGDFLLSGGTFTELGNNTHSVAGNWVETSGIFRADIGTILMDGNTAKTITTIAGNYFNNLTIGDGADIKVVRTNSSTIAVDVDANLTVATNGTFEVLASHSLTLEDVVVNTSGTLTATGSAGNDALLGFQTATDASLTVNDGGALTLTGASTSERNAIIRGANASRIDFDIGITNGATFTGTDFTIEFPDAEGFNLTGSILPTIARGTFDEPIAGGCLLNFVDQLNLPTTIDGCIFNNAALNAKNVKANDNTASNTDNVVTFINFSGDLCGGDPGIAGDNSTNPSAEFFDEETTEGHIEWFNNIYYSVAGDDGVSPSANFGGVLSNFWSQQDGDGFQAPLSALTNSEVIFRIEATTMVTDDDWTIAGNLELLERFGFDGILEVMTHDVTIGGTVLNNGQLTIKGSGSFEVNGSTYDATAGATVFTDVTGTGTLKLASTTNNFSIFTTNGVGTVEYDGAAQDIVTLNYNNLKLTNAGNKTALAALDIDGNFELSNTATFLDGGFDHTVAGNWSDANGIFSGTSTITFDGGNQSITTDADLVTGNNFSGVIMSGSDTKTAATALDVNGDFSIAAGVTFAPAGFTHGFSGNWNDSDGEFAPAGGIINFDGGNQNITTDADLVTGNNFSGVIMSGSDTKTAATALDVNGDFSIAAGVTFAPAGFTHGFSGNWDDSPSAGGFVPTSGLINFDGTTTTTITTNAGNYFNNLTIGDGTDTKVVRTNSSTAVNVEATLTVATNGTFEVLASHSLTLEDVVVNTSGTLTATGSAGNDALLGFQTATDASLTVNDGGALTLTGASTSERNAIIRGANASRIDFDIGITNGATFTGTDFTIEFPDAEGFNLTGSILPTIARGTFDEPFAAGCLLNFVDQLNLPTSIDGCIFNNAALNAKNVKANDNTASNTDNSVSFVNFSGDLCGGDPGIAGDNSTNPSAEFFDEETTEGHINWFNNIWYSHGSNFDASDHNQWWNNDDATPPRFNPQAADFLNQNHEFKLQTAYDVLNPWTIDAKFTITSTGNLDIDANKVIAGGDVLIENGGTLSFSGNDADNTIFDSNDDFVTDDGGKITFAGGSDGKLQLEDIDATLPTAISNNLTSTIGTVEYDLNDGSSQTIYDTKYFNLIINGSGSKIVDHLILDVHGDLTVTAGTLDLANSGGGNKNNAIDLEGDFSMANGTFDPGTSDLHNVAGIWNETGGVFQPTDGTFTFSGTGGKTIVQNAGNNFFGLTIASGGTNKISANSDISVGGVFTNTNGTFDTEGNTVTVTGATNIDGGILEIAAGIFDADGDFDATGQTVTFTGNGTLKLGGDAGKGLTPNLGTLNDFDGGDVTTGTVIYDNQGGDQAIYANSLKYFNLTIDNNGQNASAPVGSALEVLGDLTITTGKLTLDNAQSLTLAGNFLLTSGELDPGSNAGHTVGGNWTETGGTTFEATLGRFTFNAVGGDKTITTDAAAGGNKFFDLFINTGGVNTVNAGSELDIDGELQVTDGTLAMAGNSADVAGITDIDGTLSQSTGSIFTANGNIEIDASGLLSLTTGTFTANQITDIDGTLSLTTGTFTANGLTDVDGTLSIEGTGTFTANGEFDANLGNVTFTAGQAGNLTLKGAVTSLGTFTSNSAGTVTYNGTAAQDMPGTPTYNNLIINNTFASSEDAVNLTGNPIVDGTLSFTSGCINTGSNNLTIGENGLAVVGAINATHINGNCSKIYNNLGAEAQFNFPVGNGALLRPIKLIVPAGADPTTFKVKYFHTKSTVFGGADIGNGGGVDATDPHSQGALNHISGYMDPTTQGGDASDLSDGYYFNITRPIGSKNAQLYLEWSSADTWGTGGGATESLRFARYNDANWVSAGGTLGGLGQARSGNLTSDAISDFTGLQLQFTLASTDVGLFLPIDLLSFEGECIDNKTNLEFVVASQVNNDYFTIKRSTNNLEWEEVGYINGGGTNNEEITYTWTDHSPKSGVNYYKLFQTDIDGLSKSFSPIAINCESKVEDYHIYPNPTNGIVSVEFDLEYYQGDDIQMVLKDFKGVIVNSNPIELKRGYNYFELDLSNLPNGFYVLSYSGTKNHIPSKRIVKL